MTVGLPGAGIGGLFYLISALTMPVHAVIKALVQPAGMKEETLKRAPWRLIWKQFATAVGIIIGLYLTGLALGALLLAHPTAMGQLQPVRGGKHVPNVLKLSILVAGLATLGAVLVSVQIGRLVVASNKRQLTAERAAARMIAATCLFMFVAHSASAQSSTVAQHIAAADRAFEAEDTARARAGYEAALAENPCASRAVFRLGQLAKNDSRRAQSYFKRYVELEPADAWGWMALGDSYSASRDFGKAIAAYDRALAIEPAERDAVIGRARVLARAGRTDAAIDDYAAWTSSHQNDAEALRELAAQRRRAGQFREAARTYNASATLEQNERALAGALLSRGFSAPAIELVTNGAGDSDENRSWRIGAIASAQLADRARVQLSGGHRKLTGYADVTVDDGSIGLLARPLAAFRLEAIAGVARPHSTLTSTDTIFSGGSNRGRGRGTPPVGTVIQTQTEQVSNIFVGSARGVWRQPGGSSSLDLRATRMLLDATPVLVLNRVVRNEIAGRADVGVIPRVKIRTGARAGSYNTSDDSNTRISLLGGLAVMATNTIEVSGMFQRLSFDHATTTGYFAPRLAQLAELASYSEFESENGIVLALDAGAGAQRLAEFGAELADWEPSYRLFASLDIPMRPGSSIHFDLDSYDSRLGSDVATTSTGWRFVSLSASVRIGLR